ncbi:MAG: septum formation initiator family protein [Acidobacteria bacterium]|nr:septum formation initiator family protein [Acidobacteriota bacterium]
MTETEDTQPAPTPPVVATKATLASRGRRLLRHGLIFFTFVIVVDAIAGEKGLLALLQARREYAALERSLERARTENADLREQVRRLREDPNAIEEQARRELGLIKPGEMVFFIKDVDQKP